jgi:preprotein translocase subunit YajC
MFIFIVMFMIMFIFMFMIMILLLIQVDRLNPAETSECSNSRPKGFSVTREQGDPWSV